MFEDLAPFFMEVSKGSPGARERLIEKLEGCTLPKPRFVNSQTHQNHHEDIRQKFLLKIWEGKVLWDPERCPLLTPYLMAILLNLWKDLLKQNHLEFRDDLDNHPQKEERSEEFDWETYPVLNREKQREARTLSLQERVVLKLWRPYLFSFSLEEDEEGYLQKSQPDLPAFYRELKEAMETSIQEGHDCLSPATLSGWLGLSRNNIDQILYRIKEKLPWLRNLSGVLES